MSENDLDPIETQEWLEAINSVIDEEGIERASFLLSKLANKLNQEGAIPSYNLTTPLEIPFLLKSKLLCLVIFLWKEELGRLLDGML